MEMKKYLPKECNWNRILYERIINMSTDESNFLRKRDVSLEQLRLWNRTAFNTACTIDIIPYEELIYLETKYKDDVEIQQLIKPLKERIAAIHELKMRWLDLLIDKNIYSSITIHRQKRNYNLGLYSDRMQEVYEWHR